MAKITPIDIQHRTFKKALQGYDRVEVDQFLDEVIEAMEDDASARAALEAEMADLRERISHFKAMEESLQNTLILAQRTADEVKASAHKEADLIRKEARVATEREIGQYQEGANEARREYQGVLAMVEKARSEMRSLLMTHLGLLERTSGDPHPPALVQSANAAIASPPATNGEVPLALPDESMLNPGRPAPDTVWQQRADTGVTPGR